jgi:hypothetical protein
MFETLNSGFVQDLARFKDVLDAHDCARWSYEQPPTTPDPWANIRPKQLPRKTWHIYDHCAAFTRLYAIYSTYMDELIEEYLAALPGLYPTYDALPGPITTQHRVGAAMMLGKIGDDGKYQQVSEQEIITTLANGIAGGDQYKLLVKAFLPDRANYRLDVVVKVLGTLGVDFAAKRIGEDAGLSRFLAGASPDTNAQGELERFIKRRNESAHSHVSETVSTDEIKMTADFIRLFGLAVSNLLSDAVVKQRYVLGQLASLGIVEEVAYGGFVAVTHLDGCMLRRGDRFALVYHDKVILAMAAELQLDNVPVEEVILTAAREVGIKFDRKIKKGATICALRDQQTAPYQVLRAYEQRKDEIVTAISDKLRLLSLVAGNGADLTSDSTEAIEIDPPELLGVSDPNASMLISAHVPIDAPVFENPVLPDGDGAQPPEQAAQEDLTSTVSIRLRCRFNFPSLAALADPQVAVIEVELVDEPGAVGVEEIGLTDA